jgi:hypothetical protein
MKLIKNIFILSLIVCMHPSFSMQQPTQKKEITPSLGGLPPDLKRYLMPFVASGFPPSAARGMFAFATINKEFNGIANDEPRMLALLQDYQRRAPYDAHVVDLGKRLSQKTKALPVVQNVTIRSWLAGAKRKLEGGVELYGVVANDNRLALQQLLTNKKIDLNWEISSHFRDSPLGRAIEDNFIEVATALLKAGAALDEPIPYNFRIDMLRLLLTCGMNPNSAGPEGYTHLMGAAQFGYKDIVKLLLWAGANPDLKDASGNSAADYAWMNRRAEDNCPKIFNILNRASYKRKLKLLAHRASYERKLKLLAQKQHQGRV